MLLPFLSCETPLIVQVALFHKNVAKLCPLFLSSPFLCSLAFLLVLGPFAAGISFAVTAAGSVGRLAVAVTVVACFTGRLPQRIQRAAEKKLPIVATFFTVLVQ